jgi:DNA-binding MarR family transcriptional regulator
MENKIMMLTKFTNNIYRLNQAYLDKHLEKFELTTGTYPYLIVLKRNSGISQNEISRELNVDKAMSARSVKKLIELGYIKKEENIEDIRAYKLYLTTKAEAVIPEILEIIQAWIGILADGISDYEAAAAMGFLEKVLENGRNYRREHCERVKEN